MTNSEKKSIILSEKEWQIILDSLSNTIFNEEITEEARKNAKELYLKINKNIQFEHYICFIINAYDLPKIDIEYV